jgi:hypothetical protein
MVVVVVSSCINQVAAVCIQLVVSKCDKRATARELHVACIIVLRTAITILVGTHQPQLIRHAKM